jgi:hypothetical protein
MVDLTMKSEKVRVSKILKFSKAKMFQGIEVGDLIQLSVKPKHVGGSKGRTYAVDVRIDNLTKNEHVYKTFNTLGMLENFEFKEE